MYLYIYIHFSTCYVSIFHDPTLFYYKRVLRDPVMNKNKCLFLLRMSGPIFLGKII